MDFLSIRNTRGNFLPDVSSCRKKNEMEKYSTNASLAVIYR